MPADGGAETPGVSSWDRSLRLTECGRGLTRGGAECGACRKD